MTEKTPRKHEHLRKWQPGESGNPKGRPKGSGLAGELRRAIGARAVELVEAMLARALEGDTAAASVLLARVLPALKPEAGALRIPGFAAARTLGERADAALRAAGNGEVPTDAAAAIVAALAGHARIVEAEELERRIRALEERTS